MIRMDRFAGKQKCKATFWALYPPWKQAIHGFSGAMIVSRETWKNMHLPKSLEVPKTQLTNWCGSSWWQWHHFFKNPLTTLQRFWYFLQRDFLQVFGWYRILYNWKKSDLITWALLVSTRFSRQNKTTPGGWWCLAWYLFTTKSTLPPIMEVEKTGVSSNRIDKMSSHFPTKKKTWFIWRKKVTTQWGQKKRWKCSVRFLLQGQGTCPSEEPANAKNFMTNLRELVLISLMIPWVGWNLYTSGRLRAGT